MCTSSDYIKPDLVCNDGVNDSCNAETCECDTLDPTYDPVYDPSLDPTLDPTLAPTKGKQLVFTYDDSFSCRELVLVTKRRRLSLTLNKHRWCMQI